ncbi:hypothetical protein QFZ55_007020 [Streptomyces luteogriseus]|nr:hypothetical protein [Streptomyces luteogriseus]
MNTIQSRPYFAPAAASWENVYLASWLYTEWMW